jgi:subtilisin family serine protease
MKKSKIYIFYLGWMVFGMFNVLGQVSPGKYWVAFTDKNNTPYSVDKPYEFLSERAIERRQKQGIEISESDLPVDPAYLNQLNKLGFKIINVSKWLNGVILSAGNDSLLDTLNYLSFVKNPILKVCAGRNIQGQPEDKFQDIQFFKETSDYGNSDNQIEMLKGEYLHEQGYEGQNMIIAIQDAGFTNANSVSSLMHLWLSDRVIAIRDYVKDSLDILKANQHGTVVLSIIAGVFDKYLYGTAVEADFVLTRTEDGKSEYLIEEYNWVCGAEFVDSLGADVINSSVGYSTFNDSLQNHSYKDMDGKTTPVSIGVVMAASKGILVVSSAGNEGNNSWYRITAPADADSILSVGAVDEDGVIAYFSSRGPSFDGRIKPDICAQGYNTTAQLSDGTIINCNGTSCSAPLISGLAACLWQANISATSQQLIKAIQQSSSLYDSPDMTYGYGIPNFTKADRILKYMINPVGKGLMTFNLFPSPARNYFYLEIIRPESTDRETIIISYVDLLGRTLNREQRYIQDNYSILEFQNIEYLPTGINILRIELLEQVYSLLFLKTN